MAGSASLLWVMAGLVGLVTVAPRLDEAIQPSPSTAIEGGFVIARAPDGQFYTQARTEGATFRLMVDPGAEQVLLSRADAESLGLEVKRGFTPVTLAKLSVGSFELERVEAVIAPDLPVSLLGRSYLSRLSNVDVASDRMVLR